MRKGYGAADAGLLGDDVKERIGGKGLRAGERGAQAVFRKAGAKNGGVDAERRQGRERAAAAGVLKVDGCRRAGGGKRFAENGRARAARVGAEEVGGGDASAVLGGPFDRGMPAWRKGRRREGRRRRACRRPARGSAREEVPTSSRRR